MSPHRTVSQFVPDFSADTAGRLEQLWKMYQTLILITRENFAKGTPYDIKLV
jgi:hypothetical protein